MYYIIFYTTNFLSELSATQTLANYTISFIFVVRLKYSQYSTYLRDSMSIYYHITTDEFSRAISLVKDERPNLACIQKMHLKFR